jgi:hypothetical protein
MATASKDRTDSKRIVGGLRDEYVTARDKLEDLESHTGGVTVKGLNAIDRALSGDDYTPLIEQTNEDKLKDINNLIQQQSVDNIIESQRLEQKYSPETWKLKQDSMAKLLPAMQNVGYNQGELDVINNTINKPMDEYEFQRLMEEPLTQETRDALLAELELGMGFNKSVSQYGGTSGRDIGVSNTGLEQSRKQQALGAVQQGAQIQQNISGYNYQQGLQAEQIRQASLQRKLGAIQQLQANKQQQFQSMFAVTSFTQGQAQPIGGLDPTSAMNIYSGGIMQQNQMAQQQSQINAQQYMANLQAQSQMVGAVGGLVGQFGGSFGNSSQTPKTTQTGYNNMNFSRGAGDYYSPNQLSQNYGGMA